MLSYSLFIRTHSLFISRSSDIFYFSFSFMYSFSRQIDNRAADTSLIAFQICLVQQALILTESFAINSGGLAISFHYLPCAYHFSPLD